MGVAAAKWTSWRNEGGWGVDLLTVEDRRAEVTLVKPDGEKQALPFPWDQVEFARRLAEDMAEAARMKRV